MYYPYQNTNQNMNPYYQMQSTVQMNTGNPPAQMMLGQAYVPAQTFQNLMDPAQALTQGTVFQDLVMPYQKRR